MQNSISFSIESIISRIDPPKQKEDDSKAIQGIASRGPLSAMQNLVELTPRGDLNYFEETVPTSEMEREKLDKRFHGENLMVHSSSLPSSKFYFDNFSDLILGKLIEFNNFRNVYVESPRDNLLQYRCHPLLRLIFINHFVTFERKFTTKWQVFTICGVPCHPPEKGLLLWEYFRINLPSCYILFYSFSVTSQH